MDSITLQLPLPHRALSPNSRSHWACRAEAVKAARLGAAKEAARVLDGAEPPRWEKARYTAIAYVLTNRRRDQDNFIASLKAYLDGIASAGIVIDDCGLRVKDCAFELVDTMPRVEITITPEP